MGPISLRFDVTDALPADVTQGQRLEVAAWLFAPDDLTGLGPKPVVMTLLSGGSYDKRYHHAETPGRSDYSAAEYLTARGNIVLLPDHLGVGESTRAPDQTQATRQIVARATHAACQQFYERLRAGDLHASLPALPRFTKIGAGHSMGGMLAITQQAEHATFDGAMIIGCTTLGVHLWRGGAPFHMDPALLPAFEEDYAFGGRAHMHETFHWPDVPAEIIAADDALGVPTPNLIGTAGLYTDQIAQDAAKIETPVYLCFGERDVSPNPHGEPESYTKSADITLHILKRSGHCQNFASTRHEMWDRMHDWSRTVTKT